MYLNGYRPILDWVGLIILLLMYLPPAWSGCIFEHKELRNEEHIFLPTSIYLPSDTPAQTVIWSSGWTGNNTRTLTCDRNSSVIFTAESNLRHKNNAKEALFDSGDNNFALKIIYRDQEAGVVSRTPIGTWHGKIAKVKNKSMLSPEFRAELVSTGSLKTGAHFLRGGKLTILMDERPISSLILEPSVALISPTGCKIMDDDIIVRLGQHDSRELIRSNFTSYVPFDIRLDCDDHVRIRYSINGLRVFNAPPGVLALDRDGTFAGGVGIQIADEKAQPVILNQYRDWKESQHNRLKILSLKARYIRTTGTLTPGQANATATISFIYR